MNQKLRGTFLEAWNKLAPDSVSVKGLLFFLFRLSPDFSLRIIDCDSEWEHGWLQRAVLVVLVLLLQLDGSFSQRQKAAASIATACNWGLDRQTSLKSCCCKCKLHIYIHFCCCCCQNCSSISYGLMARQTTNPSNPPQSIHLTTTSAERPIARPNISKSANQRFLNNQMRRSADFEALA